MREVDNLRKTQMIGTTSKMQNSRNITYPSITICTKRPAIDPFFYENANCWPCEYERKTNLTNIFQWLVYYYVNEAG